MGFLLIIIYFLNYYHGKKKNIQILSKWLVHARPIFEQNFSHIGVSPLQGGTEGGALFDEESCYTFKFYASGRINCDYCIVTLDLKKRQDLLTMFLFNMIWIEKDNVMIDIPLNFANVPPIVFGVVRKKDAKNLHTNNLDFKYFCKKLHNDNLSEQYVILGENEETKNFILDTGIVNTLNRFDKNFQMMFITDQKSLINCPLSLRIMYTITNTDLIQMNDYVLFLKMAFYLIDKLSTYKMSSTNLQKAEKERQAVQELKAKDEKEKRKEELEKKKLEKKKQDEAKLRSLPADQKRKLEEKEHKQTLKKKYPRKILKF